MKIAYLPLIVLLPFSLSAEEVTISNGALSLTTGQHAEHLLSGISDLHRDQQQLRQERRSAAPMFAGKSAGDKGGSRVSFQQSGKEEIALWSVVEADVTTVLLESENAGATAQLTTDGDATAVRIVLEWKEESPLAHSPLRWEWMLEVGGDFFAVPTEGVADHQIYLAQDNGGLRKMRFSPIQRESQKNFTLIKPWWAVADRNRATMLVCRLAGTTGTLEVQQTSGNQGSADAFEQAITLPTSQQQRRIEARISLYSGLQFLSALGETTAYQLSRKGETAALHAATERLINSGKLTLIYAGERIAHWPIAQWTPKEPLVLPVGPRVSQLPVDLKDCWLELNRQGESLERIPLYQEDTL